MKLNFNKRLKEYLLELIIREGDEEAWEHLKACQPSKDELSTIIIKTKFSDEAWELFKQQSPEKEDLIRLIKQADENKEFASFLLEQSYLDDDCLEVLVEHAHSDEAARILLFQNPNKEHLLTIMEYTDLKDEVAALLLNQSLENDELVDIITESGLKHEAWQKLLLQAPSNDELLTIIQFTDLEELAWEQFLRQNPTNEELMVLVNDYSDAERKRTEATALILKQDPDIETLCKIIDNDQMADEAWELLQKKSPTCKDLSWLIWRDNIKINEASAWSLKNKPNKEQLFEILESQSEHKALAAEQLMSFPLETKDLVNIILNAKSERAVDLLGERVQFDRSKVNEEKLIQEIKVKVLQNPELLHVNQWHKDETHCLGGWAIALHEEAQEIEKQFSSEVAACLLLPNYTHLFFADRETVLKEIMSF